MPMLPVFERGEVCVHCLNCFETDVFLAGNLKQYQGPHGFPRLLDMVFFIEKYQKTLPLSDLKV